MRKAQVVVGVAVLFTLSAADARRISHRSRGLSTRRAPKVICWGPKQVQGPRLLVRMGAFSGQDRLASALGTGRRVVARVKLAVGMPDRVARKTAMKVADTVRQTAHHQELVALAHRATRKEDRVPAVKKPILLFDIGPSRATGVDMTQLGFVLRAAVQAGADAIRVPASVSHVAVRRELARAGALRRVSVVSSLQQLLGSE